MSATKIIDLIACSSTGSGPCPICGDIVPNIREHLRRALIVPEPAKPSSPTAAMRSHAAIVRTGESAGASSSLQGFRNNDHEQDGA